MVGKMIKTDVNIRKEDWGLFLEFSMAAEQMDPNNKKRSILVIGVEPIAITDPKFWKLADRILDTIFGTRPTRSVVTRRSGTSHIDQSFWENLTKVMGSSMGAIL